MSVKCDVCGEETSKLYVTVNVKWHFSTDGYTLFGGLLNPNETSRTLCGACFAHMAETMAVRLEDE